MKIALLGTRGVPAQYGGFETAVEEIGKRLVAAGHSVTVYTRTPGTEYEGMKLVFLPTIATKYTETLFHSFLSACHAITLARPDVAIVFNAANAPVVAPLRPTGIPYALHVDGLEWQRAKWSGIGKRYYLGCERLGVRTASRLIADSHAIASYYEERYGVSPAVIAYGAPPIQPSADAAALLATLDLEPRRYHLVVARFEPENHVREILLGYSRSRAGHPLAVVGSAPYAAQYVADLESIAARDARIRLFGPVWDQTMLDELYANCSTYLHGHSVGGTNPSLLRAAGAGAAVVAFDVSFNREVAGPDALYFTTADELVPLIEEAEAEPGERRVSGERLRGRVITHYDWDCIAAAYGGLCADLAAPRTQGQIARWSGEAP